MVKGIKQITQEFANDSTIHSVNFIADGSRNKSTRLFWTIALILSVGFFGLYTYNAYIRWQINPDFLIRTHQRHVNEIPFPALTICSPLFARDHLANSRTAYKKYFIPNRFAKNMSSKEANYLMATMQARNLLPNRTDTNIVKLLNESALHTNELLVGCFYKTKHPECDLLFNRVLTDYGFCFSFNMEGFNTIFNNSTISKDFHYYKRQKIRKSPFTENKLHKETFNDDEENSKWSLDKGFSKIHQLDEVPIVAQKGFHSRFVMFLNKSDASNLQVLSHRNFYYQLHLPNEIFAPLKPSEFIYFYELKDIYLTAKIYRASNELRSYPPEKRGCYFEGERSLKYFKTYTKNHCEFECLTNYTLDQCNCVKFSMPRNDSTPVCGETQTRCYYDMMKEFPKYDPITRKLENCNCLKTCSDIKYETVFTKQTKIDIGSFHTLTWKNASEGDIVSTIIISFSTHLIEEEEMYASYTIQNFVSDTGGLLGLFMGCSLLSIVEIFFFFSHVITQFVIHLWKKFYNRNRVQNIIQVRPSSTNDTQLNDLKELEKILLQHLQVSEQRQFHRMEQRVQQENHERRREQENYDRQLRHMNENIAVIRNFIERHIRIERF